jgi:hypothetical protein
MGASSRFNAQQNLHFETVTGILWRIMPSVVIHRAVLFSGLRVSTVSTRSQKLSKESLCCGRQPISKPSARTQSGSGLNLSGSEAA